MNPPLAKMTVWVEGPQLTNHGTIVSMISPLRRPIMAVVSSDSRPGTICGLTLWPSMGRGSCMFDEASHRDWLPIGFRFNVNNSYCSSHATGTTVTTLGSSTGCLRNHDIAWSTCTSLCLPRFGRAHRIKAPEMVFEGTGGCYLRHARTMGAWFRQASELPTNWPLNASVYYVRLARWSEQGTGLRLVASLAS